MLLVVNHHYIRPKKNYRGRGIFGTDPDSFEDHINQLKKFGRFLSVEELYAALNGTLVLPSNQVFFFITFDDGLKEQVEYAVPVLEHLGTEALFFVNAENFVQKKLSLVHKVHLLNEKVPIEEQLEALAMQPVASYSLSPLQAHNARLNYPYDTDAVACFKYWQNFILSREERLLVTNALFQKYFSDEQQMVKDIYMSPEHLQWLANRQCLGCHGYEHVPLGSLTEAQIRSNLYNSVQWMKSQLNYIPKAISYPYGSKDAVTSTVGRLAKEAGYDIGFTMERAVNNLPLGNALFISRFDINDTPYGKMPMFTADHLAAGSLPQASWFID